MKSCRAWLDAGVLCLCISRLHCLSLCRLLSGPAARVISSVREDGSRKSRSKSVSGFTGLILKLASGKPTTPRRAWRASCPLSPSSVVRLAMRLTVVSHDGASATDICASRPCLRMKPSRKGNRRSHLGARLQAAGVRRASGIYSLRRHQTGWLARQGGRSNWLSTETPPRGALFSPPLTPRQRSGSSHSLLLTFLPPAGLLVSVYVLFG